MAIPVYLKIKDDLLQKIQDGTFRKGERLPSENALSLEWNASRMTVRRALDELTREGVLFRTRGSGTFVAANRFSQCDIMSFSQMVREKNAVPSTRVLEKTFLCREDIALAMHLPQSTVFFTAKRLRLADSTPVGVEQVFLPIQFCPKLDTLDLTGSLYEGLKNLYGWTVARQDLAVTARIPTKEERALLEISHGSAVMQTEGASLDEEGRSLFYEQNVYAGEAYIMHVSVKSRWLGQ